MYYTGRKKKNAADRLLIKNIGLSTARSICTERAMRARPLSMLFISRATAARLIRSDSYYENFLYTRAEDLSAHR